jgi:hypothetical protein
MSIDLVKVLKYGTGGLGYIKYIVPLFPLTGDHFYCFNQFVMAMARQGERSSE